MHPSLLRLLASVVLALATLSAFAQDDVPVVAAAADLQFAVEEVAQAFKADTGMTVALSFGSTGNFATQIRQGAPFELFMAADERFVGELHAEGLTRDAGTLYAIGRVVLIAPLGSTLMVDANMDGLAEALATGGITRFAIGNPEHAPYGLRAEESLRHKGLWEDIEPRLVLGENVSQAAQFALSGDTQGGIIAYSLALAPSIRDLGTFALIPEDWHDPLRQRMVLLSDAGPVAEAFYDYMQGDTARAIMERYGFVLPEGE